MRYGRKVILQVTGFTVLICMWHIASHIRASPGIPPPWAVLQTTINLITTGTLISHLLSSLEIVLSGIVTAIIFGFWLGILVFMFSNFKMAILPIIESVRGVAALTLFPLLIVIFGIGNFSRIFIIFWTAWPAVVLSTIHSLKVDESIVEAARVFGATEWKILWTIRIPIALPSIFTGVRIGVSGGWIGLVAAEMLGATSGLGYFLLWSAQSFQFERVYATIVVIAVIGGLMNFTLLKISKLLEESI